MILIILFFSSRFQIGENWVFTEFMHFQIFQLNRISQNLMNSMNPRMKRSSKPTQIRPEILRKVGFMT